MLLILTSILKRLKYTCGNTTSIPFPFLLGYFSTLEVRWGIFKKTAFSKDPDILDRISKDEMKAVIPVSIYVHW